MAGQRSIFGVDVSVAGNEHSERQPLKNLQLEINVYY